jgi:hypothetical protein
MIEIVLGFALSYAVPMFLLKRYIARRRREVAAVSPSTTEHRKAELDPPSGSLRPAPAGRP